MHFQSPHFKATKAQIEYLRAIHTGKPNNTNWATMNRCHKYLVFTNNSVSVKPEIVAQFNLDK